MMTRWAALAATYSCLASSVAAARLALHVAQCLPAVPHAVALARLACGILGSLVFSVR